MVTTKLTSKGQITIPRAVLESLHLQSGDRMEIEVRGRSEVVLKPIVKSVDDVFGMLHDPQQPTLTVEDMNAAIHRHMQQQK